LNDGIDHSYNFFSKDGSDFFILIEVKLTNRKYQLCCCVFFIFFATHVISFNPSKDFYFVEINMFSRSTLFVQQLATINSRRNLSFKQLNEIKPILSRNLAWFSGQSVKQNFGLSFQTTERALLGCLLLEISYRSLRRH
jgi:hypothetical protein